MQRRLGTLGLGTWCVLTAVGCGAAQTPIAPKPAHLPTRRVVPLVAKTSQELGSVDPAAVKRAFSSLDDKFSVCQARALDRVEVLAGGVKFFLRIAQDGSAKWAYLEESEIGDRETEKCLVDVVMGARWPRPNDGDAEARYTMDLPLQSTRPPSDWAAERVLPALSKSGAAIDRCKAGASATFHGTVYVGPGGKVIAAGVAMSGRDGEDKADCLAKALVKMQGLPSPGSWPAKATFKL